MSRHHNLLIRARHGAALAGCGLLVLVSACSRSAREVEIILPETRFEITAGTPAVIERALAAGAYSLTVTEDLLDVETSLTVGDQTTTVHDPIERHGKQIVYLNLPAPATIRLEVSSTDHRSKVGVAQIEFARWSRTADAAQSQSEQGDSRYSAALVAQSQEHDALSSAAALALHEAADHYRRAGDRHAERLVNYIRGRYAYLVSSDWQAAEKFARAAKDLANQSNDAVAAARADVLTASARIERANELAGPDVKAERAKLLDSSNSLLVASTKIFADARLPIDQVAALTFQGVGQWAAQNADEARATFVAAVAIARASNDAFSEARALGNLAWLDYERADIRSAADEYSRLLDLIEKERQPDLYASTLGNYANCLTMLGDFDRPLQLHTEALRLFVSRGDDALRAKALLSIGDLLLRMGSTRRALETLETSLPILRVLKDQTGIDSALASAGRAAGALGDHERALSFHQELLDRNRGPRMNALARVLMAGDLRELKKYGRAASELKLALAGATELTRANALVESGKLGLARRELRAAADDLLAADRLYADLGLDFPRIAANTALARVRLTAGDRNETLAAADKAIELIRLVRMQSASAELRANFIADQYAPYEIKIQAQLSESTAVGSWNALLTAESVRARLLKEWTTRPVAAQQAEYSETERLLDQLSAQQVRLESQLQTVRATDSQSLRLRRDIVETRARFDALSQRPDDSAKLLAGGVEPKFSLADIQAQLDARAAILYFFVGEESSIAWRITAHDLRQFKLPGRAVLAAATEHLADSLERPSAAAGQKKSFGADNAAIRQLGLLAEDLEPGRLFVFPDGPLNSLPFVALSTKPSSRDTALWLDRFTVSYAPSLALAMQSRRSTKATTHQLVAVVADPIYAADDSRLATSLANNASSGASLRGSTAERFVRLPYSAIEAAAVASAFQSSQVISLTGFDADVARVSRLPFDQLAVLHVATHAIARPDSPGLSALYLSKYLPDGSGTPKNSISSDEIVRMGMRGDLVVLSACSTGDGSKLSGEGVLGLTHSLLSNGSGEVVASLWPVQDSLTAQLMSQFYQSFGESNDAAAALQNAQRQVRDSIGLSSAPVWASFIVRANRLK